MAAEVDVTSADDEFAVTVTLDDGERIEIDPDGRTFVMEISERTLGLIASELVRVLSTDRYLILEKLAE